MLSALFEARSRRQELKTTEVVPVKKVTELIQRFEDEGLPKDEVRYSENPILSDGQIATAAVVKHLCFAPYDGGAD